MFSAFRVAVAFLSLWLSLSLPARAAEPGVQAAMQAYLEAYARGDEARLARMTIPTGVHAYGSDASEFVTGMEGLKHMLADDQLLWAGKARFGAMRNISSERGGDLATLFFDDDFILGGKTVPVRFATVWRWRDHAWKLVQSSNVVPTVGQSAAEILGRK